MSTHNICLCREMRIKALQALYLAPLLHIHQASAITLTKLKCVLHVMSLYILNIFEGPKLQKQFSQIYGTCVLQVVAW